MSDEVDWSVAVPKYLELLFPIRDSMESVGDFQGCSLWNVLFFCAGPTPLIYLSRNLYDQEEVRG